MTLHSIWFAVRIARRLGLTLQDCEFEEIAPLADRAIGSHYFPFAMNAHDTLYIFHHAEHLNHNRAVISSDYGNSANIIDSDFATGSDAEGVSPNPPETVIDFGSIAARAPTIKFTTVGTDHSVRYATSDDDVTYSAFTSLGIFDAGSNDAVVPSTTFRYLKVQITPTAKLTNPIGVAVQSSGIVVVVSGNNILRFDPADDAIVRFMGKDDGTSGSSNAQFDAPSGIAIDSNDRIIVADRLNHRVQIFNLNGAYLGQFGSEGTADGQFDDPEDVAVDSNDNIFVADRDNSRIQKFDSNGVFIAKVGSTGTGDGQFNNPIGIAVDSSDNVYVVDNSNDNIQKFTNALAFTQRLELSFNPTHIAIDSLDNILILEASGPDIEEYDTSLAFQSSYSLDAANGNGLRIAVDSSDNIYVTDNGDDVIYKYNSSKVFQETLAESGTTPVNSKTSALDEIFDSAEGSGEVDLLALQMRDPVRNEWVTMPDVPTIILASKATANATPTKANAPSRVTTVPNCSINDMRLRLRVIDGKSRDSVVFVRHGKQA